MKKNEPSDNWELTRELRRLSRKVGYLMALMSMGVGLEIWEVMERPHNEKEKIVQVESGTTQDHNKKSERQPDGGEVSTGDGPKERDVRKLATPAPPGQ